MATRFYLSAAAETTAISPSYYGGWDDTSIAARVKTDTTKRGLAMTQVDFADSNAAYKEILFRQYVSARALTAGQTITGNQAIKCQCRVMEDASSGNMLLSLFAAVYSSGGNIQKVLSNPDLIIDTVEATVDPVITNRSLSSMTPSGNYTTVAGDRLVFELGMSGDPGFGGSHGSSMSFGDDSVPDLPEDDSDTASKNPWVQLADTLTFVDAAPRSCGYVFG